MIPAYRPYSNTCVLAEWPVWMQCRKFLSNRFREKQMRWPRDHVRILQVIRCVNIDMDNPRDMEASGPFEARYLAFLETITQLRPRLHPYSSRMSASVL